MITILNAHERDASNLGWLKSQHTFSFGNYYHPSHMGFQSLRVINDERVAPGAGFDTHSHKNMDIISYALDGVLEHKDSMGNGSIIKPGEVQRLSAGTGKLTVNLITPKTTKSIFANLVYSRYLQY